MQVWESWILNAVVKYNLSFYILYYPEHEIDLFFFCCQVSVQTEIFIQDFRGLTAFFQMTLKEFRHHGDLHPEATDILKRQVQEDAVKNVVSLSDQLVKDFFVWYGCMVHVMCLLPECNIRNKFQFIQPEFC